VRVASLPEGEDPDTFVDKHGKAALEAQLDQAIDVFDRKVQILERGGWFADLHRRRQAIDRLLPTIRAAADPLTRDMYVARASEASGVDRTVLLREVEAGPRGARRARGGTASRPMAASQPAPEHQEEVRFGDRRGGDRRHLSERREGPTTRTRVAVASAERELVRAMLGTRTLIERIAEQRGPADFRDARYHEIFAALLESPDATVERLAEALSPDGVDALNHLLSEPDAIIDIDRTVAHSLARLEERDLREDNARITREMSIATGEEQTRLLEQKMENQRRLSAIDVARKSSVGPTRRA
jgi:DNA primase